MFVFHKYEIPTGIVDLIDPEGMGGGGAVPPNESIGMGQTYRFAPPPPLNNFDNLKNS